jgi:hypothetical protein
MTNSESGERREQEWGPGGVEPVKIRRSTQEPHFILFYFLYHAGNAALLGVQTAPQGYPSHSRRLADTCRMTQVL